MPKTVTRPIEPSATAAVPAPLQPFADLHQTFLRQLQEALGANARQQGEAERAYAFAQHSVQLEAHRKLVEAHDALGRALAGTSGDEDGARKALEAQREFSQRLEAIQADSARDLESAGKKLAETLQEAQEGLRHSGTEAWSTAVRGAQAAWSPLEPGAVDPATIATIAQTLFALASSASGIVSSGQA